MEPTFTCKTKSNRHFSTYTSRMFTPLLLGCFLQHPVNDLQQQKNAFSRFTLRRTRPSGNPLVFFGGVTCLTLLLAAFFISSWRPRDVFRSWDEATEEEDYSYSHSKYACGHTN